MVGRNGKRPAKRGAKKKAGKKAGGELVRQAEGGALWRGPSPNNVPGTGRPPSAIRATARQLFDQRIPTLASIADKGKRDSDRIAAIDKLGKYGFDEVRELVITSDNARAFFDCISKAIEELAPEHAVAIQERAKKLMEGASA